MTEATSACAIQIVIDCVDAHVLADWWAETLGWIVEPQDETFIRSMIEQGFATEADTVTHRGAMVWKGTAAIHAPEPAVSGQPRFLFQDVPETKSVKNRIHFDVRPQPHGSVDLAEFRQRLIDRGATAIGQGKQGPHEWVILADPEGNEFCV